jgi:hypothetical protein
VKPTANLIAGVLTTGLILVAYFLLGWMACGCHRVVEYPRATCPVLATLPTGEVVGVPREPSCPLPGPRPAVLTAKTLELGDVLQADALNLSSAWLWMDEADLYIGCVNALPAGEP